MPCCVGKEFIIGGYLEEVETMGGGDVGAAGWVVCEIDLKIDGYFHHELLSFTDEPGAVAVGACSQIRPFQIALCFEVGNEAVELLRVGEAYKHS